MFLDCFIWCSVGGPRCFRPHDQHDKERYEILKFERPFYSFRLLGGFRRSDWASLCPLSGGMYANIASSVTVALLEVQRTGERGFHHKKQSCGLLIPVKVGHVVEGMERFRRAGRLRCDRS